MAGKKIAVLIDWYLPGTRAGGPVRSVYSLLQLLKKEFSFYVITTNTDLGSNEPYTDVPANRLFEKDGIQYYYFSKANLKLSNIERLLAEIDPSMVYLNSFWSYPFSIGILRLKRLKRLNAPLLLAPRGMLGKGAMSLKYLKKRALIAISHLLKWHEGISFHATRPGEEKDIRDVFANARIFTAPNVNALTAARNNTAKEKGNLKMFFLSRISKVKNLDYALQLLREIPAHINISYDIYGNVEDEVYWKTCEEIIKTLPSNVTARYKGELPFNRVQEVIGSAHVLLLPTLNENYGHSIVESLLSGCPVIISDQTPWNDVEKSNAGFAIPLKDSAEFRKAVIHCANLDQQGFTAMSNSSIEYISKKINLAEIARQYKEMFDECIENKPL
jgi:glycosyltransferase involved in cell wall biosynthesis